MSCHVMSCHVMSCHVVSFYLSLVRNRLSKYRILREVTGRLSPTTGNLAVAFALNRLGTPIRVFLTTWLMPYTAPFINGIGTF